MTQHTVSHCLPRHIVIYQNSSHHTMTHPDISRYTTMYHDLSRHVTTHHNVVMISTLNDSTIPYVSPHITTYRDTFECHTTVPSVTQPGASRYVAICYNMAQQSMARCMSRQSATTSTRVATYSHMSQRTATCPDTRPHVVTRTSLLTKQ